MPITVSIPTRSTGTPASTLSSRKLLAIAVTETRSKSSVDVQSAIVELQTRRHYLKELAAEGLLNEL
jgi:hypothetical protein